MREIKSRETNVTKLFQSSNHFIYSLIYPENYCDAYPIIRCKDYFNELFLYVIFGQKFGKIFGYTDSQVQVEKLQPLKEFEFFLNIRPKKDSSYEAFPKDYLEKINNLKEDLARNGMEELADSFSIEEVKNGFIFTISRDNIAQYPPILSYITEKVREFAGKSLQYSTNSYLMGSKDAEFNYLRYFWDNRNKYTAKELFKKYQDTTFHNNSGFLECITELNKNSKVVSVYGTLRKGFYNHYLLKNSLYLGTYSNPIKSVGNNGIEEARLFNLGGYPGIKFYPITKNPPNITIEKYLVDQETLERLDKLEGYLKDSPTKGLYDKRIINGYIIYTYNHSVNEKMLIKNGDYASIL